jgi:hypothetical protein
VATTDRNTAVGVFADRTHAEYAVEELRRNGFRPDQIDFVVPDAPSGVEAPPLEQGGEGRPGADSTVAPRV